MSLGLTAALAVTLIAADPKVTDETYSLEHVVAEPDLVTPVGAAFDDRGRLLVVESHTHFRPDDYAGPKADRIRLVHLSDEPGAKPKLTTYYEGTTFTMGLRAGPDGWMYVATRMELFRLKDADGDGVAEIREEIAHLDTEGNYPHNGLSGIAFGPDGKLYVGMGENLGVPYTLVGEGGDSFKGHGEGGNVFRCDVDGSHLERIATGFWNPFGLCFDKYGRLYAVDNDPDASPPCRLLHVVPGGDYGFQFRYGRTGKHPLQAWDGELPGTLPMAAGTGEAPCAVVPHEGTLWVTSWGHHRIERFVMTSSGATVTGRSNILVQGDENFRPVDLAVAPNDDVFFTDWVDKSYPLHGKGRLWRLRRTGPEKRLGRSPDFPVPSAEEQHAIAARSRVDLDALASDDPFLHAGGVWGLVTAKDLAKVRWDALQEPKQRQGWLEAHHWKNDLDESKRNAALQRALKDHDADVRFYALRWIADDRLTALMNAVEQLMESNDITPRLFRVAIATLEHLKGHDASKKDAAVAGLMKILDDDAKPASLRAMALRLIPADSERLMLQRLDELANSADPMLRREVIRTLATGNREAFGILAKVASDEERPPAERADAITGLAADRNAQAPLLKMLASSSDKLIAREATLAMQQETAKTAASPGSDDLDTWRNLVGQGGDAEAGWRVFFRSNGAACSRCHTLDGRGGSIGPDLTGIGQRMDRSRLIDSILQPSKEIAPQYVPWTIVTKEGEVKTGLPIDVHDTGATYEKFVGSDGVPFTLQSADIEERKASDTSIMPAGLEKLLSPEELRDLLAALGAG